METKKRKGIEQPDIKQADLARNTESGAQQWIASDDLPTAGWLADKHAAPFFAFDGYIGCQYKSHLSNRFKVCQLASLASLEFK